MAVEQTDLDELAQQIINLAEALRKEIHERLDLLDQSMMGLEQQIALITLALGEQGALIDGLVYMIDSDDYTEFDMKVKESRKKMLEAMHQGASDIEGQNSELATTLESMAKGL